MGRVIMAYMWCCQDDYCDCTKPIVEVRSEEGWHHSAWEPPEQIAEGPFISQGEAGAAELEELKEQSQWLEDAKAWYHLEPTP